MDKVEVFFEVVTERPANETFVAGGSTFGPYRELRHVMMAMKQNRSLRFDLIQGGTARVRKVTRTYIDLVETVEL